MKHSSSTATAERHPNATRERSTSHSVLLSHSPSLSTSKPALSRRTSVGNVLSQLRNVSSSLLSRRRKRHAEPDVEEDSDMKIDSSTSPTPLGACVDEEYEPTSSEDEWIPETVMIVNPLVDDVWAILMDQVSGSVD
jgi:hypothetical protein